MSRFIDFRPDNTNDGFIEMGIGIHKNVFLGKIEYELSERNGAEYIKYIFNKLNEDKEIETYIYRQKWASSTKKEFAANILHHILKASLDLKREYPELEKKLGIKPSHIDYDGIVMYDVKIDKQKPFTANLVVAILNLAPSIEFIVNCFEYMRKEQLTNKLCAIKLSQTVFMGKTKVGFNIINLPFMDSNPNGTRLRWNPSIDVENVSANDNVNDMSSFSYIGDNNYSSTPSDDSLFNGQLEKDSGVSFNIDDLM